MQERRLSPRIKKNISIKLLDKDYDLVTQTQNISAAGILCQTEKVIAEFTKLKLILLLPIMETSNGHPKTTRITCEGVVVRNEPIPGSDKYNTAIYFNRMTKLSREKISQYVKYHISKEAPHI